MTEYEITPKDIMAEEKWEEGWEEQEWEIVETTTCPICDEKLEKKLFDVDFINGRITLHGFEQMYCPECGFTFMNSKQAQKYEDLLYAFDNIRDIIYSLFQNGK
ncbi:MAG: hypothetical protein ACE5KT_09365 [Methanosarcinales archaeon]